MRKQPIILKERFFTSIGVFVTLNCFIPTLTTSTRHDVKETCILSLLGDIKKVRHENLQFKSLSPLLSRIDYKSPFPLPIQYSTMACLDMGEMV